MEIQRKTLDILFHRVSPNSIFESIKSKIVLKKNSEVALHREIPFQTFHNYAKCVYPNYSDNEIKNIYENVRENMGSDLDESSQSIFNLLAKYGNKVLRTDDKSPICRYDHVLNWRELSNKLGQDMLTTSYLAYWDLKHNEKTNVFSWRPIINTDNTRLHKMLDQGMAENHFHLGGSTQVFALS